MDLVCTRCGEPWDVDYVLHEEPLGFRRRGGRIDRCPVCPEETPEHSPEERHRLIAIRELANLLGDDIDGLATSLEDFGLL
jgi:hypothetical protein